MLRHCEAGLYYETDQETDPDTGFVRRVHVVGHAVGKRELFEVAVGYDEHCQHTGEVEESREVEAAGPDLTDMDLETGKH